MAHKDEAPAKKKLTMGQLAIQPKNQAAANLDETIPGGFYYAEDGTPHDAHNNPLPDREAPEEAVHELTLEDDKTDSRVASQEATQHGSAPVTKTAAKKSAAKKK